MDGDAVAGRYRLERKAYSGQCLSSYVARDELSDTEVEVDVLDLERAALPVPRERLREILDSSSRIDCPYASRLLSWFEEDGELYLVRERERGAPLSELLEVTGCLPPAQALEVVEALVEAMAVAYGAGLYYLGLNPGQVFVDPQGLPRLARAGYGWILEESEPLEAARACAFRAPETDGGREGTRTSDVYSLACMVELMLPGEEISGRLRSLLDRAREPLAANRPSSPRLILEAMREGERRGSSPEEQGDDEEAAPGGWDGEPERPRRAASVRWVEERRGRRSGGWRRRAAYIVCGGLFLWVAYAALAGMLGGRREQGGGDCGVGKPAEVALPDLRGMSLEEAREALSEMGLSCSVRQTPSRLWAAGRVMAQEPAGGALLSPGDEVLLVVSWPAEDVEGESADRGEQGSGEVSGDSADSTATPAGMTSAGNDGTKALPPSGWTESGRRARGGSPPVAVAHLSSARGPAPLCVRMDAGASSDPDGDIVRYVWRCEDGAVLEGATVQHVFDPGVIPSRFQVVLEVYDSRGLSDSTSLTVEVY